MPITARIHKCIFEPLVAWELTPLALALPFFELVEEPFTEVFGVLLPELDEFFLLEVDGIKTIFAAFGVAVMLQYHLPSGPRAQV